MVHLDLMGTAGPTSQVELRRVGAFCYCREGRRFNHNR